MPTVLRINGLRVVVYTNDHRPAHVHVIGNGCEVTFELNCPDGPPELRENFGFRYRDILRIWKALAGALELLCENWRAIHG